MRYRGVRDRRVSLAVAALMITGLGSAMTFAIVRAVFSIDFAALAAAPL
jgi:hypothetical protein